MRTIDELAALEAAATPGPITVTDRGGMGFDLDPIENGIRGMFWRREDAEFYAAARNQMPNLLKTARQHEALLALIRTEQQKAIADGTEYGHALAFRYGLLLEGKEHGA